MTMADKKKPAAPGSTAGPQQHQTTTTDAGEIVLQQPNGSKLALVIRKDGARIDSRELAHRLGNKHRPVMALIDKYRDTLAKHGKLFFQKAPSSDSRTGQRERHALLNEDQAFLLLNLSRNTPRVVDMKSLLVQAFGEARRAAQMRGTEYLPSYHALHDAIHAHVSGSPHEWRTHVNLNKLVNKTVGIESGQRASVTLPQQSLLTVAQAVAAQAMRAAPDHHAGFQQAKAALVELSRLTFIEGTKRGEASR